MELMEVGRSTVIDTVSIRFAGIGLTAVHPYRPSFADLPEGGREYFFIRLNGNMDGLHRFLDYHGQRSLVGLLNIGYGLIQKLVERKFWFEV